MIDKKIIMGLVTCDEECFNYVYEKYKLLIFHIIFSIIRSRNDVDDLVQDVFIQLFTSIHTNSKEKSFKYWLITIAKNKAKDYLKKKKMILNDSLIFITMRKKSNMKHLTL